MTPDPQTFEEIRRLAILLAQKADSYTFVRKDNEIFCKEFENPNDPGPALKCGSNHAFPVKPVRGEFFAFYQFSSWPKDREKIFGNFGIEFKFEQKYNYWVLSAHEL